MMVFVVNGTPLGLTQDGGSDHAYLGTALTRKPQLHKFWSGSGSLLRVLFQRGELYMGTHATVSDTL